MHCGPRTPEAALGPWAARSATLADFLTRASVDQAPGGQSTASGVLSSAGSRCCPQPAVPPPPCRHRWGSALGIRSFVASLRSNDVREERPCPAGDLPCAVASDCRHSPVVRTQKERRGASRPWSAPARASAGSRRVAGCPASRLSSVNNAAISGVLRAVDSADTPGGGVGSDRPASIALPL